MDGDEDDGPEVDVIVSVVRPGSSDRALLERSHAARAANLAERHPRVLDQSGYEVSSLVGPDGAFLDVARSRQASGQLRDIFRLHVGDRVVQPKYPPDWLAAFAAKSSVLGPCITALVNGIESGGHAFDPVFDDEETLPSGKLRSDDEEFQKLALAEKQEAERFFQTCTLDISFQELREQTRRDIETTGYGGWELLRSRKDGTLVGLEHVRSVSFRICRDDAEPTTVTRRVLSRDGSEWEEIEAERYFRVYVQIRGSRKVFFKEPGDPRFISRSTGAVKKPKMEVSDYSDPDAARELLFFGTYNPCGVYPVPRWVCTLVLVAGLYKSELINHGHFDNKAIPPLAILVQGGNLSKASHKTIAEKLEELKGVENWDKILILEAQLQNSGNQMDLLTQGASGTPRVSIEKLTGASNDDAQFQKYENNARNTIRSACGLAPIAIGDSQDYTRATAQVADEQMEKRTFAPSRAIVDDRVNRFILPDIGEDGIKFWKFRSNGADLVTIEDVQIAAAAAATVGAGTRNDWARIIGKQIGEPLAFAEEAWGKLPIDLGSLMLQTGLVKMTIDANGEPILERDETQQDAFEAAVERSVEGIVNRVLRLAASAEST